MKNKKSSQRRNRTFSIFRIRFIGFLVSLFVVATYSHNLGLAKSTFDRQILVDTWKVFTEERATYQDLVIGDILVSRTQDNAYESNAGQFFYRTGIRLGGIIQPRLIWESYGVCETDANCQLPDIRNRTLSVITNFRRSLNDKNPDSLLKTQFRRTNDSGADLIEKFIENNTIEKSNFYSFELFAMTSKTAVGFIAPIETNGNAKVRIDELKLVMLSEGGNREFSPSADGVCLLPVNEGRVEIGSSTYSKSLWIFPKRKSEQRNPAGQVPETYNAAPIGQTQIGSCGLG